MTFSFNATCFPPSHFFTFGKRKQFKGSKSGGYSGWSTTLYRNPTSFAVAIADKWAAALSWWKWIFFFAKVLPLVFTSASNRSNSIGVVLARYGSSFQIINKHDALWIPKKSSVESSRLIQSSLVHVRREKPIVLTDCWSHNTQVATVT